MTNNVTTNDFNKDNYNKNNLKGEITYCIR